MKEEKPKFKTRTERVEWYEKKMGWKPLTKEQEAILDDAVRMITNLDTIPRYEVAD